MTSYVVFDFEAIRDETVPYEPKVNLDEVRITKFAQDPSSFLERRVPVDPFPPVCHFRIVCGAALLLSRTRSGAVAKVKRLTGSEPEIIFDLLKLVRAGHTMVDFGGRGFDAPLAAVRAMRYGIDASVLFDRNFSDRYRGHQHLDLVEHVTNYGATQRPKMVSMARLVGWPGKLDVSGDQVDQMVRDGRLEEVQKYCVQDTANEAAVLLRLELVRGLLDPDQYGDLARALLGLVDSEADLEPLRPLVDRELFLRCCSTSTEPTMHEPYVGEITGPAPDGVGEEDEENDDEAEAEAVGSFRFAPPIFSAEVYERAGEMLLRRGVSYDFEHKDGYAIFAFMYPDERMLTAIRCVALSFNALAHSSYQSPGGVEESLGEEGCICIVRSGSLETDLDLRRRVGALLFSRAVASDAAVGDEHDHDKNVATLGLMLFVAVPPGESELVAAAVREAVVEAGASGRCTYRGPGDPEPTLIDGSSEQSSSFPSLDIAPLPDDSYEEHLYVCKKVQNALLKKGIECGFDGHTLFPDVRPGEEERVLLAIRAVALNCIVLDRCSYNEEPLGQSGCLCITRSLSLDADLQLRRQIGAALLNRKIASDVDDDEPELGIQELLLFVVVPPGESDLVAGAVRKVVVEAGASGRCTYRGPGDSEPTLIDGSRERSSSHQASLSYVNPSGSTEKDLRLRNRLAELLWEQGVETDGGDFDIPTGKFTLFLVVPEGRETAIKETARSVVLALGIATRCTYRGPGETEPVRLWTTEEEQGSSKAGEQ